jgi:uncharacterized metal-binding protein YceD (DUF177 family)
MADAPEFSRPFPIDHVGPAWQSQHIAASPAERAALAARFELLDLPSLTAEVKLRRVRAGRYIEASLHIKAEVVQSCVLSLEPVAAALDESAIELYGPIGGGAAAAEEVLVDPDSPEPIEGPSLDLGEIVAQHLALSLDPYPRAPGALGPAPEPGGPEERPSPFQGLAALKRGN